MEEHKFVNVRKEELNIREFVKEVYGKGKVSRVRIEYTPVGERIVVSTHKPGWVIGKRGESIEKLTDVLKKRFKMENPHVDIEEIKKPEFDAQLVADEIALNLESFGSARFKAICYKMLVRTQRAGAMGAEIRASGRLPSERAKSWRFAFGYLKKTGHPAKIVDRAESVAKTKQGVIGIKVAILAPDAKIEDRIILTEDLMNEIKRNAAFSADAAAGAAKEKKAKKPRKKKESAEKEETGKKSEKQSEATAEAKE